MTIRDMPRSGDTVPLLSLYIAAGQGNIALAVFGEALVFIFITKAQKKKDLVPMRLLKLVLIAGKLLGVKSYKVAERQPVLRNPSTSHTDSLSATSMALVAREDFKGSSLGAGPDERCHTKSSKRFIVNGFDNQWLYVAEVFERLTASVYILAVIITPFTVFFIIPTLMGN